MSKKRYILPTLAIVSVLLGSLLYNNITQAQKGHEPTQVDVVNLPVDEQGNLKIAIQQTFETMIIAENQSVAVGSDELQSIGEAAVGGWKQVTIFISWTSMESYDVSQIGYLVIFRTSKIPSSRYIVSVDHRHMFWVDVTMITTEVLGPILDIHFFIAGGSTESTFSGIATVTLYLTR